jgi:hypothetical protein
VGPSPDWVWCRCNEASKRTFLHRLVRAVFAWWLFHGHVPRGTRGLNRMFFKDGITHFLEVLTIRIFINTSHVRGADWERIAWRIRFRSLWGGYNLRLRNKEYGFLSSSIMVLERLDLLVYYTIANCYSLKGVDWWYLPFGDGASCLTSCLDNLFPLQVGISLIWFYWLYILSRSL